LVIADLTEEDLTFLSTVLPMIEHPALAARVADVLFITSSGKSRIEYAKLAVAHWLGTPFDDELWWATRAEWMRFGMIASRLGKPLASERIEVMERLRGHFETTESGSVAMAIARVLRTVGLRPDDPKAVAERLVELATAETKQLFTRQGLHEEAASWLVIADDPVAASAQILAQVHEIMAEADQRSDSGLVANSLLENALQILRRIPNAHRQELGAGDLTKDLERRIRKTGRQGLAEMTSMKGKGVDLNAGIQEAIELVRDKSPDDALIAFTTLAPFASYQGDVSTAEGLLKSHPLQGLFSTVTFAGDGRAINRGRDPEAANRYGIPEGVWRQLVQLYTIRIGLLVQGAIWPAYVQITNEHHLGMYPFEAIVNVSAFVPDEHTRLFAKALHLGYSGEFVAAVHLLAPQMEATIRAHLAEAGVQTSNVAPDGVESERGLSALMELPEVVTLFGEDMVHEIRLLFCGPLGPNLRNEVAHGLLTDRDSNGAIAIYAWWFALRLVFIPFWNRAREAADADAPADSDDR